MRGRCFDVQAKNKPMKKNFLVVVFVLLISEVERSLSGMVTSLWRDRIACRYDVLVARDCSWEPSRRACLFFVFKEMWTSEMSKKRSISRDKGDNKVCWEQQRKGNANTRPSNVVGRGFIVEMFRSNPVVYGGLRLQ